ncbi:hypothetical protein Mal4_08460 [Maioricimonas rarisocia]|uniref:Chromosome partition protein Smc n=1 Tax=Maioricimonas rarisocia TaxID=2528026 RepID=A0A517Z278_9PLAN|nr:hypothetical protein [Maioricimonas rarisocia]QDU36559.1 hypothetical protein Mal4_08460 [Maioricimonas rarisocia]
MSSAHVTSIAALRDFKAALKEFQDEAGVALSTLQLEAQRVLEWCEHDRPAYWTREVRRAFDKVAETRSALNSCQMRTVAGRRSSCIEEKQAFEKAKRRLQHSQEQVERTRRWAVRLRHVCDEFRSHLGTTQRAFDGEIPRTLGLLERMLTALEAYAEVAPPAEETTSRPPRSSKEKQPPQPDRGSDRSIPEDDQ